MQDARVRWALVALCLLALIGSGAGLYASHRPTPPPVVITPPPVPVIAALPPPAPAPVPKPAPPPKLYVHVAGAVRRPSLYLLAPGSRVMMAIHAAGGPRPNADLDAVNLAEKVHDGEKVYIPIKTAPTQAVMLAPPGNTIGDGGPSSLPAASPASPVPGKAVARAASAGKPGKLTSPAQGQVNINTAGADQLQRLPGIGPAMAARVLAYRQQAGGFQKPDDLLNVSGIGPKKYARLAPLVRLH